MWGNMPLALALVEAGAALDPQRLKTVVQQMTNATNVNLKVRSKTTSIITFDDMP